MDNFERTVAMCRATFGFMGTAILNPKWQYLHLCIFMTALCYPIVNGAIMAAIAMRMGNQRLYSTCIYVMFPNALVTVKLLILMFVWKEFNMLMHWMRKCFVRQYGIQVVDDIWSEINERCMRNTILVTR